MRARVRKDGDAPTLSKSHEVTWGVRAAGTLPKGVRVSNPLLGEDPVGTYAVLDYLSAPDASLIDLLKQAQSAVAALLVLGQPCMEHVGLLKLCGYTPFFIKGCDHLFAANYQLPEAPWLEKAVLDGEHRHTVTLPDGTSAVTEYDGAHVHDSYYEKGDLAVGPGSPGSLQPSQADELLRLQTKKPVIIAEAAQLITGSANVIKAEGDEATEERYILGVVLEPDEVDSQGDTISAEEVRNAAHGYMEDYGNIGLQHQTFVNGKIKILESYILPVAAEIGGQMVKAGTWLMAFRILDDSIWEAVKEGLLTGLSIGGSGIRTPAS